MNINRLKNIALIGVLVISFHLLTASVAAQESLKKTALGVNPAIMEIVLDEKSPSVKEIQLYNLTNFPLPIKTMVESFTPQEKMEMTKSQLEVFDASSWIEISETNRDFILQPRENRTVKMTITQPKDASPGGHYASVIFQPLIPQGMVSNESVFVFARVATLVFMQVKGDIDENMLISDFKVSRVYQKTPDYLELVLKNSGNTHLRPQGNVMIVDEMKKKIISKLPITPSIILPGTTKTYKVSLEDFDARIGRFSVKPEIVYGTGNTLLKGEKKYFYVFPYIMLAMSIVTALFIVIFLFSMRSRLSKAIKILLSGKIE